MRRTEDYRQEGCLPPGNVLGGLFNWTAFRNPAYTVYCIAGTFFFLGLYTGKLRSLHTTLYVIQPRTEVG